MCSQPASEPWEEPHRAVPDPATRPHHHLDATRPSGVLTPNNADYTTGNNVIARRRRVRFGEGPSGNRMLIHAAARGLRRPGDSPAVQQHLPDARTVILVTDPMMRSGRGHPPCRGALGHGRAVPVCERRRIHPVGAQHLATHLSANRPVEARRGGLPERSAGCAGV